MIIAAETFEIETSEQKSFGVWETGTVEITLGRETRRVPAYRNGDRLTAKGLMGRYQTGTKAWPATICQRTWADGKLTEYADFGRDDRAPQFKKLNGVSFA